VEGISNPTNGYRRRAINKSYHSSAYRIKNFCRLVRKSVYPNINLRLRHNAKYKTSDFLDLLTHAAVTNDFTTNGSKTFSFIRSEETPSADTVLYHIRRLEKDEIMAMFKDAFDEIYNIAKASNVLQRTVDLAIDTTNQPYYGDENDPMVVRTQFQRGTSYAYRFATINVVTSGMRFTLLALPMHMFSVKSEIVEELVSYAKEKVNIGTIYLDRWFFAVKVINTFERLNVKFLMPAKQNYAIKRLVEGHESPTIMDYTMQSRSRHREDRQAKFKLVIVNDDEGKKTVFATNLDVNESNAKNLCNSYSRRWGIETSYRVKGNLRPKTTSKNYVVRLFYFLFSVCLYNLWILANVFMGVMIGRVFKKPWITAKMFGTLLYATFYIDDGG